MQEQVILEALNFVIIIQSMKLIYTFQDKGRW